MKKIKQLLVCSCICLLVGCTNSDKPIVIISDATNLGKTINDGGTYNQVVDDKLNKLIDHINGTSSSILGLNNNQIAILDIFENKSNYIWYVTDMKKGIFYRFISNKKIDSIQYAERKSLDVKSDLKTLNKK
ncbi:hypothetical protein [Aquimarina brevivitae]|uniref:Lipoprotein n=1 Tax=Aquimarina brevivitae TaxID=323412 RepID=A0A4V2F5T4_9FLAO|nr:hypothetical protein [Aquimarina brevivitae]RZS93929.1 hypothetical protein EV197_2510 [Aquimarina brevivitae]